MAIVPATEFKAKCLELMDRVAEGRETFVITKRGKPVAKLVPADRPKKKSIFGFMTGRMEIVGDLDQPLWTDEEWKRFESERAEQARAWEQEWRRYGRISGETTVGQPPHLARGRARQRRSRRGRKG
jgi:prevent-host-death family protein